MQRIYLEPSVINRAVDDAIPPATLRAALARLGFEPATGLHTVYELARSFLSTDSSGSLKGQKLFAALRDLDPAYQPEVWTLLTAEVQKLRLGTAVLPFLSALNVAATRQEVARLANGFFDDRARRFIQDKERQKADELKAQERYLAHVTTVQQNDPAVSALKTFEGVWDYFSAKGEIPDLIAEVLRGTVSRSEAAELAARMSSFPAIAAAARANVYLNFITIAHLARPGRDKLDDYRHCIEAGYCAAFLSGDDQQISAAAIICPHARPVKWDELAAVVAGGEQFR
jgi:hypothetical protein